MFFNKPLHDLTFEDVIHFCRRQLPEGKQLDYKYLLPKNKEKFAKTIASFANALGGTIIVGVQDDRNDKPKPPFTGIPYQEKMRNSIEDVIQTYIDPIVFVDINICVNKSGDRMFLVINIPQSNLTPHLVGKLKRAYIRTGQSSRPEAIVHPEKLPWLLDNRKKSERLRHILYDKAESHFENYLKTKNVPGADKTVSTLSLMPMYPEEPLADYKKLPKLIRQSSTAAYFGVMANPEYPLLPVQDGAAVISNRKDEHKMTEFNAYGLIMNKQAVSRIAAINGHDAKTLDLRELAQTLVLFFVTAVKFLNHLAFGGPLAFRFKISNARALRVLYGRKQATVLEDYIRMDKTFSLSDIENNLTDIISATFHETAWALGMQIAPEEIKAQVEELLGEIE